MDFLRKSISFRNRKPQLKKIEKNIRHFLLNVGKTVGKAISIFNKFQDIACF
ncbi:hypothetical protein KUK_0197 [Taylorella equigenitalis 14/56]|uniref:Uncharacterized protein n=2 Tax=Taylorella equigenitalis TaxID=29575 RepID=I7IIK2_9BURK|nr:hypothetical protein KUI_1167 [Taylorella equigenitalis ATCC 35865]CCG17516.1 hypothetical protein KUK_0197 [Taylorella equigenitalis 14/56]